MAHEVTAGEFQAFATATTRQMPRQPVWYADATHPAVNVTWDEAQAYCEWSGGLLPTGRGMGDTLRAADSTDGCTR